MIRDNRTVALNVAPQARVRLICFPYAGAGASAFREWPRYLPDTVEAVSVQLPGRESRFSETRFTRLDAVVDTLVPLIESAHDLPFLFFGHSLGALVAYELTRALQARGRVVPFHLVVSGMQAPHVPRRKPALHQLDDAAFITEIAQFNGTPKALLDDTELMQLFLPLLRDDFAICETYEHQVGAPLLCPVTALGGDPERDVSAEDLAAWAATTDASFDYFTFPGDHFFLHPNRAQVAGLVSDIAARRIRQPVALFGRVSAAMG